MSTVFASTWFNLICIPLAPVVMLALTGVMAYAQKRHKASSEHDANPR